MTAAQSIDLPALPEPRDMDYTRWGYDADDMRGYGEDCAAAALARQRATASGFAAPTVQAPVQTAAEDALDAARWRAFVGSARIAPQGSAGLNNPMPNHYAHMGLEIWTTYDRDYSPKLLEQMDASTALGREWLIKYADVAMRALAGQQVAQGEKGGDDGR